MLSGFLPGRFRMTAQKPIAQDTQHAVSVGDTPRTLSKIHDAGCAAAIWKRKPSPGFVSWMNALDPECLPNARLILRSDTVRDAMFHMCRSSGTPDTEECDMLIDDIAAMAQIFTHLVDTEYVRCRLDVVRTNACRNFHIDTLTARLICTYRGTGTQYGVSAGESKPADIYTVPTCAPIVLRGTLWPERPSVGLRHRSPPIEGTGETRLVLVLDPVSDCHSAAEIGHMTRH